jgi:hypothetical protein
MRREETADMLAKTVRSELRDIAKRISPSASHTDAMYELYVRMKVTRGRQAAEEGRAISHESVRRGLTK